MDEADDGSIGDWDAPEVEPEAEDEEVMLNRRSSRYWEVDSERREFESEKEEASVKEGKKSESYE